MRELLAYAAARNVTVIPEIEMPGHCQAVLACHPELSCTGGPFKVSTVSGIHKDVYCAGNDATFRFLEEVLSETMELFPAPYIHIGADEVPKDRWKACPRCQARIKAEGLKDEEELQAWFIGKMENFVEQKGRKVIAWDEVLEGNPPSSIVVQHWRADRPRSVTAAELGHDVILSPYSHCYLDYDVSWYSLELLHGYEPIPPTLRKADLPKILGIEACAWEMPPETLDARIFPRLLALAEAAWSPATGKDFGEFYPRVKTLVARLETMGVVAGLEKWPNMKSLASPVMPARIETTIRKDGHETQGELSPLRIFDGSLDSYYWSPQPPVKNDTITITLERPRRCAGIKLYSGIGWNPLRNGALEISEDGVKFHKVGDARGPLTAVRFRPADLRAFRLRITRNHADALVIREFVLLEADREK